MIDDRNYAEEEVAEDLLDLIREYEAEIKKLKERESALLSSLQASLGDSAAALIKEYVAVRTDRSLRLFELDLRTRYADEEAATSKQSTGYSRNMNEAVRVRLSRVMRPMRQSVAAEDSLTCQNV